MERITIGAVKVDIYKKEREYEMLTLSDLNVVKFLVEYRDKLDPTFELESDFNIYHAGVENDLNTELISLYADLDKMIEECNFDEKQINILNMMNKGYNLEEIAMTDGTTKANILLRCNVMCNDIVDMNNEKWSLYVHDHIVDTRWLTCKGCNQELPMTKKYFEVVKESKLGFRNTCKKCRSKIQKQRNKERAMKNEINNAK